MKKTIRIGLVFSVYLLCSHTMLCQTTTLPQTTAKFFSWQKFSIGVIAAHYKFDPALGVELSSPEMLTSGLRIRLRINRTWLEQYKSQVDHWASFSNYWIGLAYNTKVHNRTSFFVELGSYNISPNNFFSSRTLHTGSSTSLGLEFYLSGEGRTDLCYFISGGYAFIHARADKLEDRPRYGNGPTFSNGFRYYLH